MNIEVKNRKSTGEIVLILVLGVLAALFVFQWVKTQTSESTQKVTLVEQRAYIEESQSIHAIAKSAAAVVAIVPLQLTEKFQSSTLLFAPEEVCGNTNFTQQFKVYCERSGGSGVILTSDGLVLTHRNILDDLSTQKIYRVFLNDGSSYDGRIAAVDSRTGLALIKIVTKGDFDLTENQQKKIYNLPILDFGNVHELKTGQKVLSLGFSTLPGNVQAESAQLSEVNLLAMNSVQSFSLDYEIPMFVDQNFTRRTNGGPVVNLDGQMIGVNVVENNISMVFPGNVIQTLLMKYRGGKFLDTPKWGMDLVILNNDIAKKNNKTQIFGVVISRGLDDQGKFLPGEIKTQMLAEKFTLRSLDTILAVNNKLLLTPEDVQDIFSLLAPGEEVELRVNRSGKDLVLKNKL